MDFTEKIMGLITLLDKNKDHVFTEEATKMALVIPFLQVLGYNPSDPTEVIPEFIADIGDKKGEKVDFAIQFNGKTKILIESKSVRSSLQAKNKKDQEHWNQLAKYFTFTKSKFAILTNGIQYQFFSDLADPNYMDKIPFFTVDLESSIRDSDIAEIRKFQKDDFDETKIISSAVELKYTGELKRYFKKQFNTIDEDFVKFLITKSSFNGSVTKKQIEWFSPIVVNAFYQYMNEVVGDTLKRASEVVENKVGESIENKDKLYFRFWTQLLEYAKTKTNLHSKISPSKGNWISTVAGVAGLTYGYSIKKHHSTVELNIFRGKDSGTENKEIFEKLSMAKKEIEQSFGEQLDWEPLEDKQACRIKKIISVGGYLDEQEWHKIQETMVDAMIRLEKALNPQIIKIMK